MAAFGMGFVHAMLIDMSDGRDRGSTWDRERRLTDALLETTLRFDDLHEPPADTAEPTPPDEPPTTGLGTLIANALTRALPAR